MWQGPMIAWDPQPLSNMNVDDLPPPLRLFRREDLYDELVALEDAVLAGHEFPKREPGLSEEAWDRFISGFLEQLPEHETDISRVDLPNMPSSVGARAVHWRLRQAIAVVGGRLAQEIQGFPTANVLTSHGILLPLQLRARLQLVLGCGRIPMTWVRATDLAGVKPARERPERPD